MIPDCDYETVTNFKTIQKSQQQGMADLGLDKLHARACLGL